MKSLILGVGGMDGSHLADLLVANGHEVHGTVRASSADNTRRVAHLADKVILHRADLTDPLSVHRVVESVRPDVVYNEADQDSVSWSHATPGQSCQVTFAAVVALLESVRVINKCIRVVQPCSATMFRGAGPHPLNEDSTVQPASPYAVAKAAAWYACRHYQDDLKMSVSTVVLFPHTSERQRGDYLVPRVVEAALADDVPCLEFDDPNQMVDVGYAPDYADALYRVGTAESPGNWVVGTGAGTPVWQLLDLACKAVGKHRWTVKQPAGKGRPGPRQTWVADYGKIRRELGWQPTTPAAEVVGRMVRHYQGVKV